MKLPLRDFSRLTGKQQLQPDIFPAQPLRMFRKPKYTHTSIKHVVLEHELERLRIIPFVSLVWNLCSVGIVLLHCYLILSLANLNSFSYISDISYFVWFWTLIFDMYDYDDEGVTESFFFFFFLFSPCLWGSQPSYQTAHPSKLRFFPHQMEYTINWGPVSSFHVAHVKRIQHFALNYIYVL